MVLNKLKDQVNGNKPLTERGKWVSLTFTFGIDNDDYLISIKNGKILKYENAF
jgi:hypothetical protein